MKTCANGWRSSIRWERLKKLEGAHLKLEIEVGELHLKGDERMSMDPDDLLTAARLYAIAALEICNQPMRADPFERGERL